MPRFNSIVDTRDDLRSVLAEPSELVTGKCLTSLDKHCGGFINHSPFVLLASSDSQGNMDISPKGDPDSGSRNIGRMFPDYLDLHRRWWTPESWT